MHEHRFVLGQEGGGGFGLGVVGEEFRVNFMYHRSIYSVVTCTCKCVSVHR